MQQSRLLFGLIFTVFFSLFISSCNKRQKANPLPENIHAYVNAYTTGIISKADPVRVQFASIIVSEDEVGSVEDRRLISFSPSVDGSAVWEDQHTLVFTPSEYFVSGEHYIATVKMDKVISNLPVDVRSFEFDFDVKNQYFRVELAGIEPENAGDLSKQLLRGSLYTIDVADNDAIEKCLSSKQKSKRLDITWDHYSDQNRHDFVIKNITRTDKASKVELNWKGSPLGVNDLKGEKTIEIPSINDFNIVNARVVHDGGGYVELNFSDPLDPNQNLDGLVHISDYNQAIQLVIDGNNIKVFPSQGLNGVHTVSVDKGLRNTNGAKMQGTASWAVQFKEVMPSVEFANDGVILPSSDGLKISFKAEGLTAVDVEVFKIFNNNILQFLQNSDIGNQRSRNLYQVGRIVKQIKVPLGNPQMMIGDEGNGHYALDLSSLFERDNNAIYQIRLGFRPEYTIMNCGSEGIKIDADRQQEFPGKEGKFKSIMDSWYGPYGYYQGYEWRQRDEPCYPAYYNADRFASKNLISSNIGVIAKSNETDMMEVVLTDLRNTHPISGANVTMYDFQQQEIVSGQTDGAGIVTFKGYERKPFAIVAEKDGDKGYMKIRNAPALSVSRFEVAGASVQEGIKGYMYADRGVWRPGDSVYLNFILEDQLGKLPPNYPISFELRDPKGQMIVKRTTGEQVDDVYPLYFKTAKDAITGNWSASVKAGGAYFSKTLKIETIKPNRLKMELDLGAEQLVYNTTGYSAILKSDWLHGAPASGLNARVEASLEKVRTRFEGYKDYVFDDPTRNYYSTVKTIFDGQLDDNGEASFDYQLLNSRLVPGKMKASFKTRVFEKGGDFSFDNFTVPYSPFMQYVGVQLPKNKWGSPEVNVGENADIQAVLVNADGKPISNKNISMGLYRVNWRWWWDNGYDDLSKYNTSNHKNAILVKSAKTNGKGQAHFDVKVEQWGRYLVRICDETSGHCTGSYFYAGSPWDDENAVDRKSASMLALKTDKATYGVGDQVTLTIPGAREGRALISLETGDEILESIWLNTKEGENEFTFRTSAAMAPNVYAHVMLIQPHAQVANDLPIRLYGVTPIMVENKKSHLNPVIKMADELRPESEFTIEVKEENGQDMAYTIAVVDEGLLGLTRFKTPNPWNKFYAKEALGIRTWDLYDEVIGSQAGMLDKVLSIGGDGELEEDAEPENNANRFKPVVMHIGPFHLKGGKKAKHTLQMPNYIGAVRTMVVAANTDAAYGAADKTVKVKSPLMVLPSMPRVLGPGEEIDLPVNVFVTDNKIKNATITLSENDDMVEIIGSATQNLSFSKPGDQLAMFKVKVKEKIGIAHFEIKGSGAGEKASDAIEIAVRNPNPYTNKVYDKVLAAGEEWTSDFEPVGMRGTNTGVLELSSIPPIDLGRRLNYLLDYPYGCIEQTLSKGFPQLYLGELVELTDAQKEELPKTIQATVSRLKRFQQSDGGFTYWPGGNFVNHWSHTYAGHFLIEAKAKGYTVPNHMLSSWAKYQKKLANMWSPEQERYGFYNWNSSTLSQAYRLYTLALYGKAELGAMNRLRESGKMGKQAKWMLAGAYALAGKKSVAQKLVENEGRDIEDYMEMSYTFGSSLRDKAMIAQVLLHLDRKEDCAIDIRQIAEKLSQNRWYSTQTLAMSLMAVAKYVEGVDLPEKLKFEYGIGNQSALNSAGSDKPIMQLDINVDGGDRKARVKNPTQGPLFARVILRGKPLVSQEEPSSKNIKLNVSYKDINGNTLDPSSLTQGTDFYAIVEVVKSSHREEYFHELALSQIFPSGWEITNSRMDQIKNSFLKKQSGFNYRDIRDDRVNTFFGLGNSGQTYVVQLTAAYKGKYYLPAVSCEAMYDNSVSANTSGMWVEVK